MLPSPLQAVDTLTPLGRGQAQLLVGPAGSGKSSLAVDAILGQHMQQQPGQQPVRCVYASVGHRYACALSLCPNISVMQGMCNIPCITSQRHSNRMDDHMALRGSQMQQCMRPGWLCSLYARHAAGVVA